MKKKLFTILLCGGLLACLTGCGNTDETQTNKEENLDTMYGTWYKFDKTGIKGDSTYMKFDGKGSWTFHSNGYVFGSDGSYTYKITDEKIILYKDSKEDYSCTVLKNNSSQISCIRSGGGVEVYGK